jgi:hypothetical protein
MTVSADENRTQAFACLLIASIAIARQKSLHFSIFWQSLLAPVGNE